jgi:hypothetical protein
MNKTKFRLLLLPAIIALVALQVGASHAYSIPERLEFDLTWIGIKAGTAVLEVRKEGEDGLKIVSTASSDDWVSVFYKVRDRVESFLKGNKGGAPASAGPAYRQGGTTEPEEGVYDPLRNGVHDPEKGVYDPGGSGVRDPVESGVRDPMPVNYRIKVREGKHRRDKEVVFDREGGKALYINHLKPEKKEFDVPEEIFDPLSAFYRVRNMELEVGRSVYVPVFDSKKVWNVEVKVLGRERVKVPAGTFDTIKIKPVMESEGIFARKGEIYIWVTDDERKVPVKLNSEVAVGSINAVLVGGSF